MRDAETILGIIQERGKQGLPLERVYRQLYNPELFLRAYGRIYRNDGALTPGSTKETVDGMSMRKIDAIIDLLRHERYRWTPVRRTYIPKKSGKLRPLGLPTWSDKLLQEVLRSILNAYYEPQFDSHSHGFRPRLGCHTALGDIVKRWRGVKWFIEGDIAKCFDRLDHSVMQSILSEKLHDNRLLRLIANLLKAGYLEDWKYHATLSGSPQGGVISPILSNIYLDKLDSYVATMLVAKYHRGERRKRYPPYMALLRQAAKERKAGRRYDEARRLRRQAQGLPSRDPNDPDFRRLRYVRYADDCAPGKVHLRWGFVGPSQPACGSRLQTTMSGLD